VFLLVPSASPSCEFLGSYCGFPPNVEVRSLAAPFFYVAGVWSLLFFLGIRARTFSFSLALPFSRELGFQKVSR